MLGITLLGPDAADLSYRADVLGRLKALKARYDPENLFRRNQNIRPE